MSYLVCTPTLFLYLFDKPKLWSLTPRIQTKYILWGEAILICIHRDKMIAKYFLCWCRIEYVNKLRSKAFFLQGYTSEVKWILWCLNAQLLHPVKGSNRSFVIQLKDKSQNWIQVHIYIYVKYLCKLGLCQDIYTYTVYEGAVSVVSKILYTRFQALL